jgi:hypothetical protein
MMQQDFQQNVVKRRVSYFYDPDIGNYHYGQGHPMKVTCIILAIYQFLLILFLLYSLIEFV